jgi:predicted alpha-1,2-mannosidase
MEQRDKKILIVLGASFLLCSPLILNGNVNKNFLDEERFVKIRSERPDIDSLGLIRYVDPFIGAVDGWSGGHTFPGASLPYGMVKLGPDCGKKVTNSGYDAEGKIQGFSHVHVSGTGGPPKYGNVLVMATHGDINVNDYGSYRSEEKASPGFFSVNYKDYNIQAEFTVSHSVGFHNYTFNKSGQSNILFDLGSFLTWFQPWPTNQEFVGSEVQILSDTEIQGYTRIRKGWNDGEAYTVYFYAEFDTPSKSKGTWKSGQLHPDSTSEPDTSEPAGAFFTFDTKDGQQIKLKVGISFVSTGKARLNIDNEIDHWDFQKVKQQAAETWNNKLQNAIVETKSKDKKIMFYTALYHTMLMPSDRTGENPLWISDAPYYDDFYCIWDTYRATHPLITILDQDRQVEMINSLLDIYEHEGYMPDARSGNETGITQGGSNSDVLIADAFSKSLKGIDFEKALNAMIKNAEVPPGGNERNMGRGGIPDYNNIGYVSTDYERAGSRTVEYAFNDYCIARVAKGLGKSELAEKYLERSSNWKNLWHPGIEADGAYGFIIPRHKDGSWQLDWELNKSECWDGWLYEGNSWEYSFYVPHDVPELIRFCGGPKMFESRLDTFFTKTSQSYHAWLNDYYNVNNEPSFLTPALYNYIGKPHKTSLRIREIIADNYSTGPDGLPGNDDAGSMSAWYAFQSMGFFPVAGTDIYLITAPSHDHTTITLGEGKKFSIVVNNLSNKNIYIQSASLNGQPLERNWFRHAEIADGGVLELKMGRKISNWGSEQLPPGMLDLL